ncbi:Arm DNA-binding domain-containing protein [Bacillus inaquosorum]|nr:Arm DNA-binding domain-containing protein [Bacillus inaquosorum]MCY7977724.1 Arm DNA-binding domain-containing protein [Bacillus inaquosorum]MEC0591312.1 Arm DNA-binding domain-containing protein [Bacillus inaquosorum]
MTKVQKQKTKSGFSTKKGAVSAARFGSGGSGWNIYKGIKNDVSVFYE